MHPDDRGAPVARLGEVRHDWTRAEVAALFALPFGDLVYHAQGVHRRYFDPNRVQVSTLLSVKTGACPEDCGYCSQSVRHDTGLAREALLEVEAVARAAAQAKAEGATRFCMGAAWRSPKARDLAVVIEMVRAVRALGLETCATLGMLNGAQAAALKAAGLDYYNHNLDTSPEYYPEIVSTHSYADRLGTLAAVREAGLKVCCGGILGMGESPTDRVGLLHALATLPEHPDSVPINQLIPIPGTPLEGAPAIDPLEFVRAIAVARLLMPRAYVRLSAGRSAMSDELQALCFLCGANSIFLGEKLLTADNPDCGHDRALLARLQIEPEAGDHAPPASAPGAACARAARA